MKGEVSLKQAIKEYREIYLAYRNFSQRTRIEYVNDLEDLIEFLERIGLHNVTDVELPNLIYYMAELEKRGFAGSTRKRKVISIRSFFGFLRIEGYILSDIGKRLIPPHVEAPRPRYLTKEEYGRLIEYAKPNKRDYAIIQLLSQTGIKLSELTRLTLNDLKTTEMENKQGNKVEYIRVVGNQGNRERGVPINLMASSAISDYLSIRERTLSDTLFLNKSGEPLGKRGVEKLIDKYFKLAGIENASVNALRHTFGAYQASMGTKLNTIQKVMGHKDRKTTGVYYQLADQFNIREMKDNIF